MGEPSLVILLGVTWRRELREESVREAETFIKNQRSHTHVLQMPASSVFRGRV